MKKYAAAFAKHVARMRRVLNASPAALEREAVIGLSLVDDLERALAR